MDKRPPEDEPKNGKLIPFPNGKTVDMKEIGADYVAGAAGSVPQAELVDPAQTDKDVRDREQFVKAQDLVQAAERGASTSEWIDIALREIAEESAHLKWERKKAAKDGKNTANFTVMRVGTLRQLAEVLLKRKEAALAERLDLKSERFQKIFKTWMKFFYESMSKSGVEETVIDLVFQQMKADMVDWEKKIDEGQ